MKLFESLWQYHRYKTTFNNIVSIAPTAANLETIRFENKFAEGISAVQTAEYVELAVSLKYLENSWKFQKSIISSDAAATFQGHNL